MKAYNISARKYRDRFARHEAYHKQIKKFISHLPEKAQVLDIGCGPGINARTFLQQGHPVTGLDFSEEMLKLARARCPETFFIQGDVRSLDLQKKYDALCASFIIVHLTDKEALEFLDKLPLLSEKGTRLYISFMTGKNIGYETTSFSKKKIFFNYYEKAKIIEYLEKSGFSLITAEEELYEEEDGSVTTDIFLIMGYR